MILIIFNINLTFLMGMLYFFHPFKSQPSRQYCGHRICGSGRIIGEVARRAYLAGPKLKRGWMK
jgi:hypothetical protein